MRVCIILFASFVAAFSLLINVHQLSVKFTPRFLLWGVSTEDIYGIRNSSFTIDGAQIVGIVGDSGAGKSCFLKCLTAEIKPSHGTILFSDYYGKRQEINAIYINRDYVSKIAGATKTVQTVICEKIEHACHLNLTSTIEDNLNLWDLTEKRNLRVCDLCISDRYRVTFAVACASAVPNLSMRSTILGLDELLDLEDSRIRAAVEFDLKRVVQKFKLTVFFITHVLHHAAELAEHGQIIHWSNGEVLQVDSPGRIEYLTRKPFQQSFGCR